MGNQLLHKGKAGGAVRVLDEENPLELAADGDNAIIGTVRLAVEHGGKIDFFVAQEGERMTLVHHLRTQNGENLLLKKRFPVMLLLFGQMGKIHFVISVCFQCGQKMLIGFIALDLQLGNAGGNGGNLFRGRHMGHNIQLIVFEQGLVIQ